MVIFFAGQRVCLYIYCVCFLSLIIRISQLFLFSPCSLMTVIITHLITYRFVFVVCYIQTITFGYLALKMAKTICVLFIPPLETSKPLEKYSFLLHSNSFFLSSDIEMPCTLEKIFSVLKENCRLKQQCKVTVFVVIHEIHFFRNIDIYFFRRHRHCTKSRYENIILFVSRHPKYHGRGRYIAVYGEGKGF